MADLSGETAPVTGGGRSIGAALARRRAADGAVGPKARSITGAALTLDGGVLA